MKIRYLIFLLLVFSACSKTIVTRQYQVEFGNFDSTIENEGRCFDICKANEKRVFLDYSYCGDYEVFCEDEMCLCKFEIYG